VEFSVDDEGDDLRAAVDDNGDVAERLLDRVGGPAVFGAAVGNGELDAVFVDRPELQTGRSKKRGAGPGVRYPDV
jgi:hypothetical protein